MYPEIVQEATNNVLRILKEKNNYSSTQEKIINELINEILLDKFISVGDISLNKDETNDLLGMIEIAIIFDHLVESKQILEIGEDEYIFNPIKK